MLEKMEVLPAALADPETRFSFPMPENLAPPLLSFEKASVGYVPERPVLRHLDLRLDPDDRIGLLGSNGNGKTTLARLIADELEIQGGEVHRASRLRVGYVAQHHADELDGGETAVDHLRSEERRGGNERVSRCRSGGAPEQK